MARTFIGFKPYFHQKAVIDELKEARGTGKVVVCKSSRQKGKSYMIANLLLYFAINFKQTKNYCLSPSFKQAKTIYQTIVDAVGKTGVIKTKNKTDLIITLINGSTINFKSAEQREQLRGYTADFLCIDEAAFISDDVFYLVLPWCDAKKAPILMTSTPFMKGGFFYQYFNYGKDNIHNTSTIDWADEIFKPSIEEILPPEKLEEYRSVLPKNVFLTEYLGEWLDDDGAVFVNIHNCLKEAHIEQKDRLYVGIDWSNQGQNDDTVISIFNQDGQQVYLKYFNDLTPLNQIQIIYNELEPLLPQISVIASETNSLGTPYTDLLKNKSQFMAQKIRGFNTSNTSKNAVVAKMQVALEQENVSLLPDDKLKRQFGYFTAEFNPKTRNVSYNAPQGLHDDIVMATLLAYDAYDTGKTTGNYHLVNMSERSVPGMLGAKRRGRRVTRSISYIGK